MNEKPDNFQDGAAWYSYFRMSKSIDQMPIKFNEALAEATTPQDARLVMTAYAACGLNILVKAPALMNVYLAEDLHKMFGLAPTYMMNLAVADMAALGQFDPQNLQGRLNSEGFKTENGYISGFEDPFAPKPAKSAPTPKPF